MVPLVYGTLRFYSVSALILCDVRLGSHQINITYTHVSDIANYFKCNFSHLNTAIDAVVVVVFVVVVVVDARCMIYLFDIHVAIYAVIK